MCNVLVLKVTLSAAYLFQCIFPIGFRIRLEELICIHLFMLLSKHTVDIFKNCSSVLIEILSCQDMYSNFSVLFIKKHLIMK